jgi:hypothetical protein
MNGYTFEDLAAWADRKRVRGHLIDGRADAQKCDCSGQNCLMAQAVADHFRALEASTI